MEVYRNTRRRSRYHSLSQDERLRKLEGRRGKRRRHSKKPGLYHDVDREWERARNNMPVETAGEEDEQAK